VQRQAAAGRGGSRHPSPRVRQCKVRGVQAPGEEAGSSCGRSAGGEKQVMAVFILERQAGPRQNLWRSPVPEPAGGAGAAGGEAGSRRGRMVF